MLLEPSAGVTALASPLRPLLVIAIAYGLGVSTPASATSHSRAKRGAGLSPAQHQALALQVALDRAGFSPGEIDASMGAFTVQALAAFRAARGITGTRAVDASTARALGAPYRNALVDYTVTDADMAGPFQPAIPQDMAQKAELTDLGYGSPLEMLAERFHVKPALLTRLNPQTRLIAGAVMHVPAVEPLVIPTHHGERTAATSGAPAGTSVEVTKETGALVVHDKDGHVLMYAPVTVGSDQDPLPIGDWKVVGIFEMPIFNFNPALFWDADPTQAKARIAAGPNNPVGLVWIQINKEHFGFHGTPSRRASDAANHTGACG